MNETALVTVQSDNAGRPRKLVIQAAGLRVVGGPDKGQLHRILNTPVVIGTHRGCDLVLADPTVSSKHAEIVLRPAGYLLRDLGSRNGVFAGGIRVEQAYLAPGMLLSLGRSVIEVVDLHETAEVTLSGSDRFGKVVGSSVAMRRVFAVLESVVHTDSTVLLEGETGTGKEVIAEAIHLASPRAEGPFVVFDCSAVPERLIESELFGHEKGAFTGAVQRRAGVFERAHGGTLFLDEVGELTLDLQPKLLRVLESRQVQRVGGNTLRHVDVRIVAATHRNFERELSQGGFRQDLFYRLAVVRLRVPPLRERLDDLPLLVSHFGQSLGHETSVLERFPGLLPVLTSYNWPGNVRELRNMVERLGVLPLDAALPSGIGLHLLPSQSNGAIPYAEARERAVEEFERAYVEDLLQHTHGNVTRAAEMAGVSRRYVTRLMAKHGLSRNAEEADD